uniref:Ig-like domain-containing protein n=1 Tax=Clostridium akagii TaxID=91623 RepID=UPI001A9A580C
QTHVENIGWQTPVSDNAEAGTDGKSLRVEAIKIALENLPGYSVQYRSQVENIGWQPWVSDGQEAGTDGKALRVEAIEVRIVKTADGSTPTPVPFINNITNVASVALNKPTDTLTVGSTDTLTATVSPSNATNKAVTWTTSDSKVVSVDTTGKITAVSAGAATITATTADGNKTGTCTVTVNNIVVVPVTSVVLNKTTDALIIGNSDLLVATVVPSNATNQAVAWSSSNPAVAEVDATGKVTAVSAGTSNITATTVDGAKTSTCAITVVNPSIVSIDDITTNLVQNDTYTLPQTVVANMDNGKTSTVNVSWQPSVADTSKIGTFTFQGLVDGYSKNVKLTLNIQEYVPNLSISSYSALTINGICKSLSLNLENDGSKPVTINKIEVYQNGILVTTYTSSDLTAAGISTTVESKQNWQSGIDYALGITLNNSYVMYYTESNGSPYQYKSVIN